ncbi:MAG: type II toxin-antitoxin system VapC family toxin [Sporichthyaceae bacterium]
MTVFVDTSVIMYAAGAAHPHREACRGVLRLVAEGELAATTSTEVVQEILHRFARADRVIGQTMAQGVLDLFGDLLPIDRRCLAAAVDRFPSAPHLSARDLLHVATCVVHGIDEIVSVDTGFDMASEIRRLPPADVLG